MPSEPTTSVTASSPTPRRRSGRELSPPAAGLTSSARAGDSSAHGDEAPELLLVEQRYAQTLLPQPLDFHQLQARIPAGCLQRVRPAADHHGCPRRGHSMDDRSGPAGGTHGFAATLAQDAGERKVYAFQRAQHAHLQRSGRIAEGVDQFVCALVPLPPLADTPVDDLLQVIAARKYPDLGCANPGPGVAFDQHSQQLSHLVHIVARLPLRNSPGEDVARSRQGVHGARGDSLLVALLPDDSEVTKLQSAAVAYEHVQRCEIAVQHLAPVQLSKHLEDAGDLAACRGFGPTLSGSRQECAEVTVARVLERQAVQHPPVGMHQRKAVEDTNRPRVAVEQLSEVRLAQPPADARAYFDADKLRDHQRSREPTGEVYLAESAFPEQPFDAIPEPGFRTGDDLFRD